MNIGTVAPNAPEVIQVANEIANAELSAMMDRNAIWPPDYSGRVWDDETMDAGNFPYDWERDS